MLRLLTLILIPGLLSALPLQAQPLSAAALTARAEQMQVRIMNMRPRLGLSEQHSFVMRLYSQDALGQIHVRFNQYYKGVRIWGGEAIAHVDSQGNELPLTSALRPDVDIDVEPFLDRDGVIESVRSDLAYRGAFSSEPIVELVIYPEQTREIAAAKAHAADAEINAMDMVSRVKRYALAFHVHTEIENPGDTRHTDYLVDAKTGAIIEKWDSLYTSNAVGVGNSQYSGTVSLDTNSVTGGFELRDLTRPASGGNAVHNLNHLTSGTGTIYIDADNHWGDGANFKEDPEPTTSPNGQTAAVDAAFGIQATWDMYRNVFGRHGIDGLGTPTYARVHYDSAYDNAFYSDQCSCITYGDGTKLQTLTPLDIAAHEYSHGVCSTTAGLIYDKESGGLNEANSDIMGAMAEFYTRGANGRGSVIPDTGGTWTQGEQATTPAYPLKMRFLYKPSKDGNSADAWSPTLQNLDVHYSSGPMNRAFYFLSQGATTTGDTSSTYLPEGMAGIGNDKAAKIWFRALTTYMTSATDYANARIAAIQAVRDLFRISGPEEIAVWNAFAAINVGPRWTGPDNPPSVSVSESGQKGIVEFSATASDDKGVAKVEFLLDGALAGARTAAPYSMTYDTAMEDDGNHILVARATDTSGQYAEASMVFVIANGQLIKNGSFEKGYGVGWSNTPGVQIGAILGQTAYDGIKMAKLGGMGSRISAGLYQSVAIPATASSAILSFALHVETRETSTNVQHDTLSVQIRNPSGGLVKTLATYGNLDASPGYKTYSLDMGGFKGQTVQLYFLGTEDSAVATGFILDKVRLDVGDGGGGGIDDKPPTISVSESGSRGMIAFSATATDNVGIARVEFHVDGNLKGTVTSPPYGISYDSTRLANGSHQLVGKAFDAAGNMGQSLPYGFVVDNAIVDVTPPNISVSASGTSGVITFSANAADDVGVARVDFFVDGELKGADNDAPFTMTFDSANLTAGNHALVGKAYDAAGNVGVSDAFVFTIANGGTGNDLIRNGGFESGNLNWSGNGQVGSFPAQPAYQGTQCAWLAGKGTASTTELYQTVSIPATAGSVILSYALHIDSAEKSTWLRYDTSLVQVRNASGTSVLRTLASYSNLDRNIGYAMKSVDLGAFKGQTIQIYFKSVEDRSYQTSFVFDNVSLIAK